MASSAAQAAADAFRKIPQSFSDYAKSGQMDSDLRDFGAKAGSAIYDGLSLFLDKRAAEMSANIIVTNLQVAATMGAIDANNVGLVRAFDVATGAQRQFMDNSRRIFATVTSTLGADMSKLTDKSGYYVSTSVRNTLEKVEESNKTAASRTIETVSGVGLTLYDILPGFSRNLQDVNQAILLDTQTYYKAGTDMTKDALVNTAAVQRAFGMTSAEITGFVLRDIEKTGKASGETVMQVVAAAYAAADALGAAPRVTEKQIVAMTNNVERYGNSSTNQMAAVSKQLQELSLEVGSLDKLVGAFSGFDSAISKSNDLAALFGVQLDSMEAMYLAAEDPTKLLETIREQLLEQGVDVSNMSQSQLRALSKTMGLSVEETKRYLQDGLLTPYEEAYTKIEEGATKALEKPEELAARAAKAAAEGAAKTAEQAAQDQADKMAALTVSQTYAEVAAQSNRAISAALSEANNKQKELYESTLKSTEESLRTFSKNMPELITEFVLPFFEGSLKAVQAAFEGAQSKAPKTSKTPAGSETQEAPPPAVGATIAPPPSTPGPLVAPPSLPAPEAPPPPPATPIPGPAPAPAPVTPPTASAEVEKPGGVVTLAVVVRDERVEATADVSGVTGMTFVTTTPVV